MGATVVIDILQDVWIHPIDDLEKFAEDFVKVYEKYFVQPQNANTKVCQDIVLDNILKYRYGYDLQTTMSLIHFVKVCQMNTGKFMQEMLGCFPGWKNLGNGHETGLDLYNNKTETYIELKNRYNTDNASAKEKNYEKLAKQKMEGFRSIYGVINDKTKEGRHKEMIVKDAIIEYISADKLFEVITGISNFTEILTKLITELSKKE